MKYLFLVLIFVMSSLVTAADFKTCGLEGDIKSRIKSCSTITLKASKKISEPISHSFSLVTQRLDENDKIVRLYIDQKTKLLWSKTYGGGTSYEEAMDSCETIISNSCDISDLGVNWRLPTKREFRTANNNGIRDALVDIRDWLWSSTEYSKDTRRAYLYSGSVGYLRMTKKGSEGHNTKFKCVSEISK